MSTKPNRVRINKVKERILFLSPSVKLGHENEANLLDFDIGDMLGSGAFGYVYKVVHKTSKRIFALKVIEKGKIKKNKMQVQIQNEVKIMYSLDCDYVVRLFNHFEDDENIYLVMEFAGEGQLMNKIKKSPSKKLPEPVAAGYIRDLIKALDYIHNLSPPIIHRDIKPENLLVSADNVVKLGDFGWSNYSEDSRTTYCGTPEYLAPEMLLQKGHTDKLDIWCVGVLMFELLTGRTPFLPRKPGKDQNDTNRILQKAIIEGKPNIPADYPPLARDLTLKLLKANPRERLSLQDIKKHPWFAQNSAGFGIQDQSQSDSMNQGRPKANLASSLLTVDENDELMPVIDEFKNEPRNDLQVVKPDREFEVEGKKIEESEMLLEMPDMPDHEASKFFRRESILAAENIPRLDGVVFKMKERVSFVDRFSDALRKSTGIKTNEVIQRLNEQLTQKESKINDLQNMVEELQIENTKLRTDRDRLNSCLTNASDDTSFASLTVPSLETKLTKFVEEERDKLRLKVEELYKLISSKEEAIDILTGKV